MDKRAVIESLFNAGKAAGIEEMEVFIGGSKNLDIKVFKGDIDKYSIADDQGLSFRGIYNGKMGYSYTEKIDESSVDLLIKEVIENARVIDSEDEEIIFEGSKEYKEINSYSEELAQVTPDREIEFIKELEKEAFAIDERVVAVNYCMYGKNSSENILVNSKGLDLIDKSNIAYTYISVMVKDGEDVKTAGKFVVNNDFSKFEPKALAKKAVEEAISMLGAESIDSGDYPVVLRNNVSASILSAFGSIFSAESVQKKMSLLAGKLETEIANPILTVVDDPFLEGGAYTRAFDGEGVATKYKRLIDKGVLKTYLHSLKTAKKDNVEPTGNANKPSYKSSIGISPTNMFIEKGDKSFDEIIKTIDKGILIIDVQGLHSGLNAVSGDFSLSAYGFEIENGAIKRPVNQITIAGNFYEVLKNIEDIGDDLEFGMPGNGYVGSPSIKIKKLSVAGK